MLARCNIGDLSKAVSTVKGFVRSRVILPSERNALVTARSGKLIITVNAISAIATVEALADVEDMGSVMIPIDVLHDVLASLEQRDDVQLESTSNGGLELRTGRTRITINGRSGNLPVWSSQEITGSVTIELATLADAVRFTAVPVDSHAAEILTSSILVQADKDTLTLLGTDKYRMAVVNLGATVTAPMSFAVDALLVKKFISGCNTLKATGLITMMTRRDEFGEFVTFSSEPLTVSLRMSSVTVPDYRKVIGPDDDRVAVVVSRASLAQATKIVTSTAKDDPVVLMTIGKEGITLENDGTVSSVSLEKPIPVNVQVYLNGEYLYDGLRAFDSDVVILAVAIQGTRPVVIRGAGTGYVYAMMPVVREARQSVANSSNVVDFT